jgi:hypothetical protein
MPPTPVVTGFPPVDAMVAPTRSSAPPAVVKTFASTGPTPVCVPTVCVVAESTDVMGVITVLICCVTASTGPLEIALPSVAPPVAVAVPSVFTVLPTSVVMGEAGASGPL